MNNPQPDAVWDAVLLAYRRPLPWSCNACMGRSNHPLFASPLLVDAHINRRNRDQCEGCGAVRFQIFFHRSMT